MLKITNIFYLFISLFLYFIAAIIFGSEYIFIDIINILLLLFFFITVNYVVGINHFSSARLVTAVFIYQAVAVILFNFISYYYNGNFFMFSEVDSITYDKYAKLINDTSWQQGIISFLYSYQIDDLGMLVLLSSLYSIAESNISFNIFNLFVSIITAVALFEIGRQFMSDKYAFLSSLYFSISSYMVWFNASGLKESFLVMLIVLYFSMYMKYYKSGKFKYLIYGTLFLSPVFFFRTILVFFCLAATGLSVIFEKKLSITKIVGITIAILLIVLGFPYIEEAFNRFTFSGDIDRLIYARETQDMVKGGVQFTYLTNTLAQIIGPLPTISSSISPTLAFYSQGLIMRVLLSFFFIIGTYYILKEKIGAALPLLFFILIEMLSLLAILEGLELRKSIPHIPFIYLIAFWYMERLSDKNNKYISVVLFTAFTIMTFTLILGWNLR